DHGFSIQYPLGWTIRDKALGPNNIAIFDSPNGNATVNIRVFPQSAYESLTYLGILSKRERIIRYRRIIKIALLFSREGNIIFYVTHFTTSFYDPRSIKKEYRYCKMRLMSRSTTFVIFI
ncbi:MAG: hypothetical protein QOK70_04365, partial [Nitrososphaeraceae archaeon]|nr:hypothetical protein [Nitrososphaeraceae archaeon]